MNILFINDLPFNPIAGGIERVTDILAKELKSRGYVIYYLCGKLRPEQLFLLDYEYPALLFQFEYDGMFENQENVMFYKSLQKSLGIDIVVNQRGLGGKFNSLLPHTHAKLISVIHSVPDAEVILWLSQIVEITAPPLLIIKKIFKTVCRPLVTFYWRKKALENTKIKYRELDNYSDKIVTLSDKYIRRLEELVEVPHKSDIISIPNPNTFNVQEISFDRKERIILYVGRLVKSEKAPLRLLKIWKCLYKKHKYWKLLIIGEGEEEIVMRRYVEKYGLHNVYFEGRQSEVQEYYKKAAIVCLTSNFEGWGMVLTEGMQYGCIPVTFNNYGAAFDIIDDGLNGCLIPAFDLKHYAASLSRLMSDDALRNKMSKSAITKVNMFSVSNVVDKWEDLFKSLSS